jgi:hypothetical protein
MRMKKNDSRDDSEWNFGRRIYSTDHHISHSIPTHTNQPIDRTKQDDSNRIKVINCEQKSGTAFASKAVLGGASFTLLCVLIWEGRG